jgi:lipoprotein-anchoring transpeptidase ErfK/SrfK
MNYTECKSGQITKLLAVIMLAVAEARAEEASVAPKRIVVSLPDRKLALLQGERIVKIYDVAVGKPSTPSPSGEFQIATRVANPTWFGHGRIVAPSAKNPVGTRWIGLSARGYGIHGTNVPSSIGKAASHGCIRMRNKDVEELFELVTTGIKVELSPEHSAWSAQKGESSNVVAEVSADRDRSGAVVGSGGRPAL